MEVSGKQVTSFLLYYTIFYHFLCSVLRGVPSIVANVTDLAILLLLVFFLKNVASRKCGVLVNSITIICSVLVVYQLFTGLVNLVPFTLFLKGIRTSLRVYVIFIAIYAYFEEDDVLRFFNFLEILIIPNFLMICIQHFFLPVSADEVLGIMGACSLLYIILMQSYITILYQRKERNLFCFVGVTVINLLISIWGDLRVFFFLYLLIIFFVFVLTRPSWRKIGVSILLVLAIFIGFKVMEKIAPGSFNTISSFDAIMEYGSQTGVGYNISRFGAFDEINNLIFKDDIFLNLFGYGLGYCESGGAFHSVYGWLNYMWFMHQWTFLEMGYVGIGLFMLFLVVVAYCGYKYSKITNSTEKESIYLACSLFTIACVVMVFYNSMFRAYTGLFQFAIMAMIPCLMKGEIHDS